MRLEESQIQSIVKQLNIEEIKREIEFKKNSNKKYPSYIHGVIDTLKALGYDEDCFRIKNMLEYSSFTRSNHEV